MGATESGLSADEAARRLEKYGHNELKVEKELLWKKVIEPFRSILILILALAALVSFWSHETVDGIIILAIIAINAAIYYSQQQATNRALKSLKKYYEQYVEAYRDGQKITLASRLLVPGDIVLLSEGQKVPADLRLIHEDGLRMDESTLTGESLPVSKTVSTVSPEKPVYERENMLFSGTYVATGSGTALTVATGQNTEFGVIAKLAVKQEPKSPMQQKVDFIVSRLIRILAGVALLVFGLSLLRGIPANEALRFVLSLSVSLVPEELPIALAVVAVFGMRRMAKKNALVRSMRTIEDLGLTTVIATDKTGTLTKNVLSVIGSWTPSQNNIEVVASKALGNATNGREPFDQALRQFSGTFLDDNQGKFIKSYPFEQKLRMSGALWNESDALVLYVKGSPEHLLNLCQLDAHMRHEAESELHKMVSKGFRVIAFARTRLESVPQELNEAHIHNLQLLGFTAFADELRPESAAAIEAAHKAGISVKMITGDHFETAFHIGQTLGISTHRDQVIMGDELPASEEHLVSVLKQKTVFARILPQQKFNILRALKRSEITAMTGDGVNDVPALTNAHVGIAMGSGNDIAKDAGDMVLLDNRFASIVSAISEGRVIYDNIRRMLFYLLSTSLGEVLTMVGALLLGLPLPVTAIMILWVNLVTDTSLVIPLGLEPAEEDHMRHPPRHPRAPILERVILTRIVMVGFSMAIPVLAVFSYLRSSGFSLEYAQTVAFMMLVVAQWANAFNARSEHFSILRRARIPNHKLLAGLIIAAALQALVMFGPLKGIFNVANVSFEHLLLGIVSVVFSVFAVVEAHKIVSKTKYGGEGRI